MNIERGVKRINGFLYLLFRDMEKDFVKQAALCTITRHSNNYLSIQRNLPFRISIFGRKVFVVNFRKKDQAYIHNQINLYFSGFESYNRNVKFHN